MSPITCLQKEARDGPFLFMEEPHQVIARMIPNMESFVKSMYHVRQDFNLNPGKPHIGMCINYTDLLEMRPEFINGLISSILRYVYSSPRRQDILTKIIAEGNDESDAHFKIVLKAKEKFRTYDSKGQFSELLLYNLLLHHFQAIPIVRKMSITTNPELERNGADAIHLAYSPENNKFKIFLGEAKTYGSTFKGAFKAALDSIIQTHSTHRSELHLYKYEDFLDPLIEKYAEDYLNGKLTNAEVHLVCIIAFENDSEIAGESRDLILRSIIDSITLQTSKIKDADYPNISTALHARLNYIIFPVKELDALLYQFRKELGLSDERRSNDPQSAP